MCSLCSNSEDSYMSLENKYSLKKGICVGLTSCSLYDYHYNPQYHVTAESSILLKYCSFVGTTSIIPRLSVSLRECPILSGLQVKVLKCICLYTEYSMTHTSSIKWQYQSLKPLLPSVLSIYCNPKNFLLVQSTSKFAAENYQRHITILKICEHSFSIIPWFDLSLELSSRVCFNE